MKDKKRARRERFELTFPFAVLAWFFGSLACDIGIGIGSKPVTYVAFGVVLLGVGEIALWFFGVLLGKVE